MIQKSKRYSYAVAAILGALGVIFLNALICSFRVMAVKTDESFFTVVKDFFTLVESSPERWLQLARWIMSAGLLFWVIAMMSNKRGFFAIASLLSAVSCGFTVYCYFSPEDFVGKSAKTATKNGVLCSAIFIGLIMLMVLGMGLGLLAKASSTRMFAVLTAVISSFFVAAVILLEDYLMWVEDPEEAVESFYNGLSKVAQTSGINQANLAIQLVVILATCRWACAKLTEITAPVQQNNPAPVMNGIDPVTGAPVNAVPGVYNPVMTPVAPAQQRPVYTGYQVPGQAPKAPAQAVVPVQPAAHVQPTAPVQQATPVQPAAPVQPTAPVQPSAPLQQAAPVQTSVQTAPVPAAEQAVAQTVAQTAATVQAAVSEASQEAERTLEQAAAPIAEAAEAVPELPSKAAAEAEKEAAEMADLIAKYESAVDNKINAAEDAAAPIADAAEASVTEAAEEIAGAVQTPISDVVEAAEEQASTAVEETAKSFNSSAAKRAEYAFIYEDEAQDGSGKTE